MSALVVMGACIFMELLASARAEELLLVKELRMGLVSDLLESRLSARLSWVCASLFLTSGYLWVHRER